MLCSEILFDNSFCLSSHHSLPASSHCEHVRHPALYNTLQPRAAIILQFLCLRNHMKDIPALLDETRDDHRISKTTSVFFYFLSRSDLRDWKVSSKADSKCLCERLPLEASKLFLSQPPFLFFFFFLFKDESCVNVHTPSTAACHCFSGPPVVFIRIGSWVGLLYVENRVCACVCVRPLERTQCRRLIVYTVTHISVLVTQLRHNKLLLTLFGNVGVTKETMNFVINFVCHKVVCVCVSFRVYMHVLLSF